MLRSPLHLPAAPAVDGTRVFRLDLEPELYQFSVIADGAAFPWESLYYEMQEFGNNGVRTGPWDFKPCVGSPLVPAFWVWLNGEKLGLWPFQRISIEDLAARVFRGNMAFRVTRPGGAELRLVPYLDNPVEWLSCTLRPDPVDRLEPFAFDPAAAETLPARQWQHAAWWRARREAMDTANLTPLLRHALDRVLRLLETTPPEPYTMTILVAGWRIFGDETARDRALELLDRLVALPGWGRPAEDIYGWDGDLVAVDPMRACIQAYFGLADVLDGKGRARLLEKMRYQGERFVTMALLMRDYWGGSVLQDHGWRAIIGFSECAVNLLGEAEEAPRWLEYMAPRFRRALASMPRDGHLPASSYGSPDLYVTPLAYLREAWLAATGEDLYDSAPIESILRNLGAYLHGPRDGDRLAQCGLFLGQMAEKFRSAEALHWMGKSFALSTEEVPHPSRLQWRLQGLCAGLLGLPAPADVQAAAPPRRTVHYFEESGQVIYREPEDGLHFRVQCGPWLGVHAWFQSDNPCDRMCMEPGAGHFTLSAGSRKLLVRPDSNYALRSRAHNGLLIDGRGQIGGDLDYPMSLPSWKWHGEQMTAFRHDRETDGIFCRLNLAPLYPPELGVLHYTREFEACRGRLLCRDEVLLEKPLPLTWLFHGFEEEGLERLAETHFRFGGALDLRVLRADIALTSAARPTPVVFSYTGSGKKFLHAAFDAEEPVRNASVEFEFRLELSSPSPPSRP